MCEGKRSCKSLNNKLLPCHHLKWQSCCHYNTASVCLKAINSPNDASICITIYFKCYICNITKIIYTPNKKKSPSKRRKKIWICFFFANISSSTFLCFPVYVFYSHLLSVPIHMGKMCDLHADHLGRCQPECGVHDGIPAIYQTKLQMLCFWWLLLLLKFLFCKINKLLLFSK